VSVTRVPVACEDSTSSPPPMYWSCSSIPRRPWPRRVRVPWRRSRRLRRARRRGSSCRAGADLHDGAAHARVEHDVAQELAHRAVQDHAHAILLDLRRPFGLDPHGEAVLHRHVLGEPAQRGHEAQIVQRRRADAGGDRTQRQVGLLDQFLDASQRPAQLGSGAGARTQARELHARERDVLAQTALQLRREREPQALFLEHRLRRESTHALLMLEGIVVLARQGRDVLRDPDHPARAAGAVEPARCRHLECHVVLPGAHALFVDHRFSRAQHFRIDRHPSLGDGGRDQGAIIEPDHLLRRPAEQLRTQAIDQRVAPVGMLGEDDLARMVEHVPQQSAARVRLVEQSPQLGKRARELRRAVYGALRAEQVEQRPEAAASLIDAFQQVVFDHGSTRSPLRCAPTEAVRGGYGTRPVSDRFDARATFRSMERVPFPQEDSSPARVLPPSAVLSIPGRNPAASFVRRARGQCRARRRKPHATAP
jgi:hypothetical protein